MKENTTPQCLEDWEPCEGGELRQVIWRVKSERRTREMFKAGAVVAILLLCTFAATLIWQQVNQAGQFDYGGLSCQEVKSRLTAFQEGKIHDQQLVDSIRIHLDKCPHCGPAYEKMSDPATLSQVDSDHVACDCESHRRASALATLGQELIPVGPAK